MVPGRIRGRGIKMGKFLNILLFSVLIALVSIGSFWSSLLGIALVSFPVDFMTAFTGIGVLCSVAFGVYGLFKFIQ